MNNAILATQEWLNALDLPLSKLTASPLAARRTSAGCTESFSFLCPVDTLWATVAIAIVAFVMAWAIHSFWAGWFKGSSGGSAGRQLKRSKELSRGTAASAAAAATSAVGSEADCQKKRRFYVLRNKFMSMKVVYALPAVILVAAFAVGKLRSPRRNTVAAIAKKP